MINLHLLNQINCNLGFDFSSYLSFNFLSIDSFENDLLFLNIDYSFSGQYSVISNGATISNLIEENKADICFCLENNYLEFINVSEYDIINKPEFFLLYSFNDFFFTNFYKIKNDFLLKDSSFINKYAQSVLEAYLNLDGIFADNKDDFFVKFNEFVVIKELNKANNLLIFFHSFFNDSLLLSGFYRNNLDIFLDSLLSDSIKFSEKDTVLTEFVLLDSVLNSNWYELFNLELFLVDFSYNLSLWFISYISELNLDDLYILIDYVIIDNIKYYTPNFYNYVNLVYCGSEVENFCVFFYSFLTNFSYNLDLKINSVPFFKKTIEFNLYFGDSPELFIVLNEYCLNKIVVPNQFMSSAIYIFDCHFDMERVSNVLLIESQIVFYSIIMFYIYILYFSSYSKNSKEKNDFLFFIANNLAESEKEISSIDDNIFFYIIALSSFFLYFLEYVYIFYNYTTEISFVILSVIHLMFIIIMIPTFLLFDFGIFFLFFLRGSAPSSFLIFELLYDYIAIFIFYIRLIVQNIRLVLMFLVFLSLNELLLEHKMLFYPIMYSDYNIYDNDGFIDFELENGFFYFFFIKLPDIFFYFLYELIHLLFVILTQFSAFFIMVFWLFLFLYTFFIFEKFEKFFIKRVEFRIKLIKKLYNNEL